MLTILFNQYAPPRRRRGHSQRDKTPDPLHELIEREDDEIAVLIPCLMKVIYDAHTR